MMKRQASSASNSQPSGLSDVLNDLHAGVLDSASLDRLAKQIHAEALRIARDQHRRRGSPDGVAGASDLANSEVVEILAGDGPREGLENVLTSDDLRHVLHRKLADRWIERRRKALAKKRGGGKVRQASQVGDPDDSSPLNVADHGFGDFPEPTTAEVAADLHDVLGVFEPGSERQRILLLTLDGLTQQDIAKELGLSRDAVGRRLRESIVPTLRALFSERDDSPAP